MSCFVFHNWGKWEEYLWEGTIRYAEYYEGKPIPISEQRQKRKCKSCGKVQEEKVQANIEMV